MRIEVPQLPGEALSPNARHFWASKYTAGKTYHDAVFYCCVDARNRGFAGGQKFPFTRAKLSLTFVFAEERRRDRDNLLASAKPCLDAIVDSALILDDDSRHLTIGEVAIEVDKERAPLTIIEVVERRRFTNRQPYARKIGGVK